MESVNHIDKSEKKELMAYYHESQDWMMELETWSKGLDFLQTQSIKYSVKLQEENKALLLRSFFNDLEDTIYYRIDILKNKLELFQIDIKSFFSTKPLVKLDELRTARNLIYKEMGSIQLTYKDVRSNFFELVKPVLGEKDSPKLAEEAA